MTYEYDRNTNKREADDENKRSGDEYDEQLHTYTLERTFESRDVYERYGKRSLEYQPLTLSEHHVPEGVKNGKTSTRQFTVQRIIGTTAEHDVAENQLWQESTDAVAARVPDLEEKAPLYHYESADEAEDEWIFDRGAPMNVVWEHRDASTVHEQMKDGLGGAVAWSRSSRANLIPGYEVDRYINDDGTIRSTAEHVMEHISGWSCPSGTRQWHIRLYDVGTDSIGAVGQAHRDPCDHDLTPAYSGEFYLDTSRKAVSRWWLYADTDLGAERIDVSNSHNDFPNHSGELSFISPAADRTHSGTPDPEVYEP